MKCIKGVFEVRGQLPGATCNRARTKSAINNYQAPGYVRAYEGVARDICAEYPERSTQVEHPEYPSATPESPRTR